MANIVINGHPKVASSPHCLHFSGETLTFRFVLYFPILRVPAGTKSNYF